MKRYFYYIMSSLLLSASLPIFPALGMADDNPLTLGWPTLGGPTKSLGGDITTTSVEAYVVGSTLFLQSTAVIPYVTVTVYDQNGAIVYQTILSDGGQTQYQLQLNLPTGSYQLTLASARYGMASGWFDIVSL
jgi:hypothetical protein